MAAMPTSRILPFRRRWLASLGAVTLTSLLPGLARAAPVWGTPLQPGGPAPGRTEGGPVDLGR